jgi:cob(I)alamin adenosyltransferase
MRIYTRRGDSGETELLGGVRVSKDSPRLDAIGTLDELNAVLGLARAQRLPEDLDGLVERLQNELLIAGAELAAVPSAAPAVQSISARHVEAVEADIDLFDSRLPPLRGFIIPGGATSAALFHLARTVCRRAERRLAALVQADKHAVSPSMLAYVNRLSDLFFVLARFANAEAGVGDAPWKRP